jgi:error-prone DNA polymerase
LAAARAEQSFASVQDLAERAGLDAKDLGALAAADALKPLAGNRHRARWEVAGVERPTALLPRIRIAEGAPLLKAPSEGESIAADYRHISLSLGRHPLELVRNRLKDMGILTAAEVGERAVGERLHAAGLVITRQRPSSAAGVMFVTLEDETGYLNLIVWERVAERFRRNLLGAALLGVVGKVQKEGIVLHVVAERLYDYSRLLGRLVTQSRNFH